jgi:hypothetical protein
VSQTEQNQEKSISDELREVLGRLSRDQVRFVVARQEFATDKEAAGAIGIKPNTAYSWRYDGVPIDEAIRLMAADGLIVAQEVRRRALAKAMLVKTAGLDNKNARIAQGAATEIIEWEMGRASQRTELTGRDGGPIETKDVGDTRDHILSALCRIADAGEKTAVAPEPE